MYSIVCMDFYFVILWPSLFIFISLCTTAKIQSQLEQCVPMCQLVCHPEVAGAESGGEAVEEEG